MSLLWLISLAAAFALVDGQTRTLWKYHPGPLTVPAVCSDCVSCGSGHSQDGTLVAVPAACPYDRWVGCGDECLYQASSIPASNDPGWQPCGILGNTPGALPFCASASDVSNSYGSQMCITGLWGQYCPWSWPFWSLAADFTYYETIVYIPKLLTVHSLTLRIEMERYGGSALVTIFNSKYPTGKQVGFVYFWLPVQFDLVADIAASENRIVITQVDDYCGSALRHTTFSINGNPLGCGQTTECGLITNDGPVIKNRAVKVSLASAAKGMRFAFDCTGGELESVTYATGSASTTTRCVFTNEGLYRVTGKILASDGSSTLYQTDVMVLGYEPTLHGPRVPVKLGSPQAEVTITAHVNDPNDGTHHCYFNWGDGSAAAEVAVDVRVCSATHTYTAVGVYGVNVAVEDGAGNWVYADWRYVVVHDANPNQGFLVGGGYIVSPSRSLRASTQLGEAYFGFIVQYQKQDAPAIAQAQMQFEFYLFYSNVYMYTTTYESVTVTANRAQIKGTGWVNGEECQYLLVIADATNGKTPDGFRLKIWDAQGLLYDNSWGEPDTTAPRPIEYGDITIYR